MPMIGAEIVNALYSIVDRMFIGRIPGVGTLALTGVGITFPFIMIISAFAMLSGMGGSPLVSIARGKGRDEDAERILGTSFAMLVLSGVALTVAGLTFKRPLLTLLGASADTIEYADQYITIYLMGSLFVMLSLGLTPFINAQGFTRVGMQTVALGAVINIALDPLFIFTFGMGLRGAAWATVIAQGASALYTLLFLRSHRAIVRLKPRFIRLDGKWMKKILALGVSTFTMNLTECTVQIVCNVTLQAYGGDTYVGVMTVIHSIRQVLMMPLSGFAQGSQPVMGFNYGARRYDRVRKGIGFTTAVCLIYATAAWAAINLFPGAFVRLFSPDQALLEAALPSMRIYFSLFFMMSLQMAGQRSFLALGLSKPAVFFSLLRKAFIVAPLAWILPRYFGMGVNGVFIAEPISDLIGASACFLTFMKMVWPKLKSAEGDLSA